MSTYFAEGLPFSLVHQVSMQLFVAMGAPPSITGLTAAYGWAWNLKFLVAPFVDARSAPRHWLVAMEALLALGVLAVAVAAERSLGAVAVALGVVAVFAAVHDVAIDANYIAELDTSTQTSLSGLRVAAYRLAMLAGSGGLVALSGQLSFRFGFAVASTALLVLAASHYFALNGARTERRGSSVKRSALPPFGEMLRSFLRKRGAHLLLGFLLFYRAGDALMLAMNATFLGSLGFDTTTRGLVQGTLGILSSIFGSFIGGIAIARFGIKKALFPIAVLQSISIPLYVLLAAWKLPSPVIAVVVCTEQLAAGIGTAGLTVFTLRVAQGPHRATHFAVATALMSLATTLLGLASGFILEATSFPLFFSIAFLASVPGVGFALVVKDLFDEDKVSA